MRVNVVPIYKHTQLLFRLYKQFRRVVYTKSHYVLPNLLYMFISTPPSPLYSFMLLCILNIKKRSPVTYATFCYLSLKHIYIFVFHLSARHIFVLFLDAHDLCSVIVSISTVVHSIINYLFIFKNKFIGWLKWFFFNRLISINIPYRFTRILLKCKIT